MVFVMPSARLNDPVFVARLTKEYPWWYHVFLYVLVSPYIWFYPRSRQALYVDFVHKEELSQDKNECEQCMAEALEQIKMMTPQFIVRNTNATTFGNLAYITLHGPSHCAKLRAQKCLRLLTKHYQHWFYRRFLPIFLSPVLVILVLNAIVWLGIL